MVMMHDALRQMLSRLLGVAEDPNPEITEARITATIFHLQNGARAVADLDRCLHYGRYYGPSRTEARA